MKIYKNKGSYYASGKDITSILPISSSRVSQLANGSEKLRHGKARLIDLSVNPAFSEILNNAINGEYDIEVIGEDIETPTTDSDIEVVEQKSLDVIVAELKEENFDLKVYKNDISLQFSVLQDLKKELEAENSILKEEITNLTETIGSLKSLNSEILNTDKESQNRYKELTQKLKEAENNYKQTIENAKLAKEADIEAVKKSYSMLLSQAIKEMEAERIAETTALKGNSKAERSATKIARPITLFLSRFINILVSNAGTYILLALIFAIWEGYYHSLVLKRPGLAYVLQIAAVLVAAYYANKKYLSKDTEETPFVVYFFGFYNFIVTFLSFIHYTDIAGTWKTATKEVTKSSIIDGQRIDTVVEVGNQFGALLSHHGTWVALFLSIVFAVVVAGCIDIYVKIKNK